MYDSLPGQLAEWQTGPQTPERVRSRLGGRWQDQLAHSLEREPEESYIFRTFNRFPHRSGRPSRRRGTTESGPALVRRLPTLAWPEAVAFGVGAPTTCRRRTQGCRRARTSREGVHDRLAKPPAPASAPITRMGSRA